MINRYPKTGHELSSFVDDDAFGQSRKAVIYNPKSEDGAWIRCDAELLVEVGR